MVGALIAVWSPLDDESVVMGVQCSAIRLPGRVLLTNAHCTPAVSKNNEIKLGYTNSLRAKDSSVSQLKTDTAAKSFVFSGELAVSQEKFPLIMLREPPLIRNDSILDYQIFELEPSADDNPDFDFLADFNDNLSTGASVLLSHPAGLPLMQTFACTRFVDQGEYLHDCDSLKGSSGGALFDAVSGRLVGLHKQGYSSNDATLFADRGYFETQDELIVRECKSSSIQHSEDCQKTHRSIAYNKAVPISRILADLKENAVWILERIRGG